MKLKRKLAHRTIEGRVFVMDPDENRLHSLNETASLIWQGLLAHEEDRVIARRLAEEFEVSEQEALADVGLFIATLRQEGVITESA